MEREKSSADKFKQMIVDSERIMVTSHLSPDYDAVCSTLLLSGTVELNYPEKQVIPFLEDEPYGAEKLAGNEKIVTMDIRDALELHKPDCIVVVDKNRLDRVTHLGHGFLGAYTCINTMTAVIDHHEIEGGDRFDVSVLDPTAPAATQLIYELCFHDLGMTKPEGYGLTTMTGIMADSGFRIFGGDTYDYDRTDEIVKELRKAGTTVQEAANIIENLDLTQMGIVEEFMHNICLSESYSYTYISDATADMWRYNDVSSSKIKAACVVFANRFIRNIGDNKWGVAVYPNASKIPGEYYASFRGRAGSRDVSVISRSLGSGGGHKQASGVPFKADSIDDAVQKVQAAIKAADIAGL